MTSGQIDNARNVLENSASSLEEYEKGVSEIEYLLDFEEAYNEQPFSVENNLSAHFEHEFSDHGEYDIKLGICFESENNTLSVPVVEDTINIQPNRSIAIGELEISN